MTDSRWKSDTPAVEENEFHSLLEVDDSTGWRPYIIPAIGLLLAVGAVVSIFALGL